MEASNTCKPEYIESLALNVDPSGTARLVINGKVYRILASEMDLLQRMLEREKVRRLVFQALLDGYEGEGEGK